ncbi:MAG: ATP-binding protein [Dehalococcoidia bacterium]
MRSVRRLGVQRVALIALIALPAIVLTLRSGLERRDESAEHVRDQGLQLARGVSHQGELTADAARDLLRPIAALFAASSGVTGISTEACTAFLASFIGTRSEYVSVGLADTTGRVHCASQPVADRLTVADQPFFIAAMAAEQITPGHFAVDRVSGEPALTFGSPVVGSNAARLGVVFAAINLQRLQPNTLIEGLPEGSYGLVTDSEGTILARVPDPEHQVGSRIRDERVVAAMSRLHEGTVEGISPEGTPSLIAFAPITGLGAGAYAVIGIPSAAAFSDANRALREDLIVLAALSFIGLAAAWLLTERFILRPIAGLVRVTRSLAEGDFGARVGGPHAPNEIGELSRAFDTMAAALGARQAELDELNVTLERRVQVRTADLEDANQELEAFSYSVSHDLRSPLRTIDGFAEILASDYAGDLNAEAQRYLGLVRSAAQQMGRLIDDLLQFSRISRSALARRLLPLESIVRDALDEVRPDAAGRPVEIDLQPLGDALVDPALIRQVFVNLVANAVKFTRGRDPARITIGREQGTAGETVYFVRDNGVGFDMKDADALFGVFHRLHTQAEYEGTGVGLATVHRIVTRHRGRVWAHAEVDRGATFCFTIGEEADADE